MEKLEGRPPSEQLTARCSPSNPLALVEMTRVRNSIFAPLAVDYRRARDPEVRKLRITTQSSNFVH